MRKIIVALLLTAMLLTGCTDGGSVVIENQFISEMYEGLYTIMRECFNTFTMIEID